MLRLGRDNRAFPRFIESIESGKRFFSLYDVISAFLSTNGEGVSCIPSLLKVQFQADREICGMAAYCVLSPHLIDTSARPDSGIKCRLQRIGYQS